MSSATRRRVGALTSFLAAKAAKNAKKNRTKRKRKAACDNKDKIIIHWRTESWRDAPGISVAWVLLF
jgi:hypothetical protein